MLLAMVREVFEDLDPVPQDVEAVARDAFTRPGASTNPQARV